MRRSLSTPWNCSVRSCWRAGWSLRMAFTRATKSARLSGLSRSQWRTSYFSESRYSSEPGSRGSRTISSKAGP